MVLPLHCVGRVAGYMLHPDVHVFGAHILLELSLKSNIFLSLTGTKVVRESYNAMLKSRNKQVLTYL
jgi:hypothetical protein